MFRRRFLLFKATPLFCAAAIVTLPPRKRHERASVHKAAPALLSFFSLPSVFGSSSSTTKSALDSRFIKQPQAEIVVALTVDANYTAADVVYYSTNANFPIEAKEIEDGLEVEMPDHSYQRVTGWPGAPEEQPWTPTLIHYAAHKISAETILAIGDLDEQAPKDMHSFDGARIMYPSDRPYTRVTESGQEVPFSQLDVMRDYFILVRQHIEHFITTIPDCPQNAKIKWMIKSPDILDIFDSDMETAGFMKRMFWRTLRSAGYPTGDEDDEAGMWDAVAFNYAMNSLDPDSVAEIDQGRQESMVELIPASLTCIVRLFSQAFPNVDDIVKNHEAMLVIRDDGTLSSIAAFVRADNMRFGAIVAPGLSNNAEQSAAYRLVDEYLQSVMVRVLLSKGIKMEDEDKLPSEMTDLFPFFEEVTQMVSGEKPLGPVTLFKGEYATTLSKDDLSLIVATFLTQPSLSLLTSHLNLIKSTTTILATNDLFNPVLSAILNKTSICRFTHPPHPDLQEPSREGSLIACQIESSNSWNSTTVPRGTPADETSLQHFNLDTPPTPPPTPPPESVAELEAILNDKSLPESSSERVDALSRLAAQVMQRMDPRKSENNPHNLRLDVFEDYPETKRDYEFKKMKCVGVDDDPRGGLGLYIVAASELQRIYADSLRVMSGWNQQDEEDDDDGGEDDDDF